MKKLLIAGAIVLAALFVLGIVALNVFVYSRNPIHFDKLPFLAPLAKPTPIDVCSDPKVQSYIYAENAILGNFGYLENKILTDYPQPPSEPNYPELKQDAKEMRMFANAIAELQPPDSVKTYHDYVVKYLDAYAKAVEYVSVGDKQSALSWINKSNGYETQMKAERAKLAAQCK